MLLVVHLQRTQSIRREPDQFWPKFFVLQENTIKAEALHKDKATPPLHGSTKLEKAFDLCISGWNLAHTAADLAYPYEDQGPR